MSFVSGLILGTLALFMLTASLRVCLMALHRGDYVRDELELEYFSDGAGRSPTGNSVGGHIVTTGEHFSVGTQLIGLERLRGLAREKKIEGYRAPVYYIPNPGSWKRVLSIAGARIMSPDEFESSPKVMIVFVSLNLAFAWGSIVLIRRGVGKAPPRSSSRS